MIDKIDAIYIKKDGTVVHNILKKKVMEKNERKNEVAVKTTEPRTWKSLK